MKMKICIIITMLVLLLLNISSSLAAGPAFTGLAAKADTAETVYLNPAGMSRMKSPSWYGSPQVMYFENSTDFKVEGSNSSQKIKDDGFVFIPGLYYVRPINERWAFGIGPNAATGLGATYNDSWPGRYLVNEWSQTFIGIVPSLSYKVNDRLSIGASLSLNYSMLKLEKSVFNGIDEPDGNFELETDGFGAGVNVGLLYELTPQTRLGLVYRSEVVAENEGTPDLSGLSDARRTLLENAGVLNQDISMDTNTPQSLLVGIYHDLQNGWDITADALWLDFSAWDIDNVTIGDTTITKDGTNYQDIWGLSLGTTYQLRSDISLRAGALYLSSGLDDDKRTIMSRFDEIWALGGGVEFTLKSQRKVALDLTYFYFGEGDFVVDDVPVVGSISGEYETHYGLLLGISTSW